MDRTNLVGSNTTSVPASIGLCTTLLADNLPRSAVRMSIAIFASAAPLGAFLTYFLVTELSKGVEETWLTYWTGVLLLISGGTFLYVATVIQDLSHGRVHDHSAEEHEEGEGEDLDGTVALGVMVFGMVTPLLLSQMRE